MAAYLKRLSPGAQLALLMLLMVAGFFLYTFLLTAWLALTLHMDLLSLQNHLEDDPNLVGYMKLGQFGYTVIVFLAPPLVLAALTENQPMTALGLRGRINVRQLGCAVMGLLVVVPLVGWTAEWNETWKVPTALRQTEKEAEEMVKVFLKGKTILNLLGNLVLIALVPAIGEEVFFRGGFQRLLARATGRQWVAVLISSIFFSAIHMEILGLVPRIILGGLLGAIFAISGRLWLSILAHFINNGVQVVAFYLFNIGMIKTDPAEGDHVSWYAALISAIFTIIALMLLQRSTPPKPALVTVAEDINGIGESHF